MSEQVQERLQILKMIEEGKITPDEGAKLLEAIRGANRAGPQAVQAVAMPASSGQGKWLRIRVTDMRSGRQKVNVNIPLTLVSIGARIGAKFAAPVPIDIEEIMTAVRNGAQGKLIDVQDAEDGEHVEIFVE